MRLLSIWEKSILAQKRDVIVIGAGIVGLKAAIEVKKAHPGWEVLIVERDLFGSAASSKNAGFACFGSVSEISADIEKYGEDATLSIIQRRRRGLKRLADEFGDKVELDFAGGWEVFRNENAFVETIEKLDMINGLIGDEVFETRSIPFQSNLFNEAIFNQYEGQLNTGLFYQNLCSKAQSLDITILRGCFVRRIDVETGVLICTFDNQDIEMSARQIVVATNALAYEHIEQIDVVPVLNQVVVTCPIPDLEINGTFHMDHGYIYFRNLGNRILIGGGRHLFEQGEFKDYLIQPEIQYYLLKLLSENILRNYSDLTIDESWSGILSGGEFRLPIIKRVSDRVVIGVRLGGMGVAIGLEVGTEVATHLKE